MPGPNLPAGPGLFDGLLKSVEAELGVRLRHRSARIDPDHLARLPALVHSVLAARWADCGAGAHLHRSAQNWRWPAPVPGMDPDNPSPEVRLERAITAAAVETGALWSNQVPVASGLPGGNRRRALDLVRRDGEGAFTFVELKVGSDTPAYAAFELLGYAATWLLTRSEAGAPVSPVLAANDLTLVVLAPRAWYRGHDRAAWSDTLDRAVRALGDPAGVRIGLRMATLAPALEAEPWPQGQAMIDALNLSVG